MLRYVIVPTIHIWLPPSVKSTQSTTHYKLSGFKYLWEVLYTANIIIQLKTFMPGQFELYEVIWKCFHPLELLLNVMPSPLASGSKQAKIGAF